LASGIGFSFKTIFAKGIKCEPKWQIGDNKVIDEEISFLVEGQKII